MNIEQFAKKPQLICVELDQPEIVAEYGEPIKFWMFDHVDISTYFEFFRNQSEANGKELNVILRKIILKENGTPALGEDEQLPIDLGIAALTKVNEILGKSKTRPST